MSFLNTFGQYCSLAFKQTLSADYTQGLVERAASQVMRPAHAMTSSRLHMVATVAIAALGFAIVKFNERLQKPSSKDQKKPTNQILKEKRVAFAANGVQYGAKIAFGLTVAASVVRFGARVLNSELRAQLFSKI